MIVKIDDLEKVVNMLLNNLREHKNEINQIEIEQDYYWHINSRQIYNPYEEPGEFTLGQLSDDWSDLQQIAEGEKLPIPYHLVKLASILRIIGEETV